MSPKIQLALTGQFFEVLFKKRTQIDFEALGLEENRLRGVIQWLSDLWNFSLTLCLLPFLWLLGLMTFGGLGSNPIEALHLYTGLWSLRFLCVTLMVTPLQTLGRWRGAAPFRQLFGLTSFAYAALHLLGYLILDHGLLWDVIAQDILETPHIWPGLFGFSILLLLALTSPKYGKKLMGKNWKRLHRWIYIAAPLVIIHYAMQLKGNLADPLLYGLLILVLLGFRAGIWIRNRQVARLMIPNTPRLGNDPDDPEAPVPLRRAATKVR